MKSINNTLVNVLLFSLLVLIGIELLINYDAFDRRVALSITAVFAAGTFLVANYFVRKKYQSYLPWYVLLVIASSTWLDAIGNFMNLYTKYVWWDDIAHFAGSLAVAVLIYSIFYVLRSKNVINLNDFHFLLYVFSVAVLVTVVYELSEYFGDILFDMQRVGQGYDTSSDLTYDLLGPLSVAIFGGLIMRGRKVRP